MNSSLHSKIEGLLIGIAVGDAIGLPSEGMRPGTIAKLGWADQLKHRFIFGRGMWSDDTEQSIMIAQALVKSQGDLHKFSRSFSWELRWWILGLPAATGLATARAVFKLWLGFPSSMSGVFSAGNGSAMRTAPIAAYFLDDPKKRKSFAEAQTRITHSDPKATISTIAITELIALLLRSDSQPPTKDVFETLSSISPDQEWNEILQTIESALDKDGTISDLLKQLGGNPSKGISGYVYQTVPAVVLAGLKNDWDYEKTIIEIIAAGGDTDTTAAIAGALCGACGGINNIPRSWVSGIREWPTSASRLTSLARALEHKTPLRIRPRWSPLLLLRNLTFLAIVLAHGFRRMFSLKG